MATLDRTFIPPQVVAAVGLDLLHQRPTTSRPKRTEPAELFFCVSTFVLWNLVVSVQCCIYSFFVIFFLLGGLQSTIVPDRPHWE